LLRSTLPIGSPSRVVNLRLHCYDASAL